MGTAAGIVGAGARRVRGARRAAAGSARAAGLRDPDREPRGRHACACSASCARPTSSSARTRAARARCSTGTGSRRALLSLPRAQRGGASAEVLPRLRAGERIALVTDAGMPAVNDPGARLIAAALDAGVAGHGAPGAVRGRDGARRERARGRALPVRRLPAARRGALAALWEELASWPSPTVAFESPQRLPQRCGARGGFPTGACGLPRADEAARGGRPRDGGRARDRFASRRRARSCSSWIGAGGGWRGRRASRGVAAVAELVGAGLPRRQPRTWSRASPACRGTRSTALAVVRS